MSKLSKQMFNRCSLYDLTGLEASRLFLQDVEVVLPERELTGQQKIELHDRRLPQCSCEIGKNTRQVS